MSDTGHAMAECDAEVVDLRPGPNQGHRSRTIPPSVRRVVLLADERRCAVPGCRCSVWLDLHHLRSVAAGGGHEPWNLAVLCGAHHRLVHDGLLGLERRTDGGMTARFSDGSERKGPAMPLWAGIPRSHG